MTRRATGGAKRKRALEFLRRVISQQASFSTGCARHAGCSSALAMHVNIIATASLLCAFAASGCGRASPLEPVEPQPVGVPQPPPPPPVTECRAGIDFGPDCCNSAVRTGAASCTAGRWSCEPGGDFCRCGGERQSFFCSDFCGSDIIVAAVCGEAGWQCAPGLVRSDSCAAGTCWGLPGDLCCEPRCVDGAWQCTSIRADDETCPQHDPL